MERRISSYVGRQIELYQAIKALDDRVNPNPLIHVKGIDHIGKSRFVEQVCYHFYRHNKFRQVVILQDMMEIDSHAAFQEKMVMIQKHADQHPRLEASNSIDSLEIGNQQDEEAVILHPEPVILMAFTNVDCLTKDQWSRFESKLLDIYLSRQNIRFIVTTNHRPKLKFSHFLDEA